MSAYQFVETNSHRILNIDGCLTESANITLLDINGKMDPAAEKERCKFVNQCGPTAEMKASWLGVSSEQMSPGYVNCGLV